MVAKAKLHRHFYCFRCKSRVSQIAEICPYCDELFDVELEAKKCEKCGTLYVSTLESCPKCNQSKYIPKRAIDMQIAENKTEKVEGIEETEELSSANTAAHVSAVAEVNISKENKSANESKLEPNGGSGTGNEIAGVKDVSDSYKEAVKADVKSDESVNESNSKNTAMDDVNNSSGNDKSESKKNMSMDHTNDEAFLTQLMEWAKSIDQKHEKRSEGNDLEVVNIVRTGMINFVGSGISHLQVLDITAEEKAQLNNVNDEFAGIEIEEDIEIEEIVSRYMRVAEKYLALEDLITKNARKRWDTEKDALVNEAKRSEEKIKMYRAHETDFKNILAILDELLGFLPDDKIKQFTESDDYKLYLKIWEWLETGDK